MFKSGKDPHQNHIQLGRFGRNRTNVWNYPNANTMSRTGEEGDLLAMHPTVKPVALIADALLDCSARGEIVLDSFLGSGSTLLAAERIGRVCYGLEIEPKYVDTAIRRWQKYTGEQAIHVATGQRSMNGMPVRCVMDDEKDYEVGYGKPPREGRFMKGTSGNPPKLGLPWPVAVEGPMEDVNSLGRPVTITAVRFLGYGVLPVEVSRPNSVVPQPVDKKTDPRRAEKPAEPLPPGTQPPAPIIRDYPQ